MIEAAHRLSQLLHALSTVLAAWAAALLVASGLVTAWLPTS